MKSSGFVGGSINPCLYVEKSRKGLVHIASYLDDNLMIVVIAAIDDAIEELKHKGLVLKIVEGLKEYLSWKINFSNKKRAWLGQLHLVKNLEKKFGRLVQEIQSHKTPGTPKF